MSLAILFHLLYAQHVSDINISIIRSLQLVCWITTLVVLFLVRCVLEFRCGWVGVVSVLQAEACNTDTNCSFPSFSSTTSQNFPGVSDLLPDASKFQHHIKLTSQMQTNKLITYSPLQSIIVHVPAACTSVVFQAIKPYLQSLSVIWRSFGNAIVQLQHDAYGVRRIAERIFTGDLNKCNGGCHYMPVRGGSQTVDRQNIMPTLTGWPRALRMRRPWEEPSMRRPLRN